MNRNELHQRVRNELARIESELQVRVLFACECVARRRPPAYAERILHRRRSGKAAAARVALPRATATTTCAFSTSTEEAEGN